MKRVVMGLVVCSLLFGLSLMAFAQEAEFSVEEEVWLPSVKMDSMNRYCTDEVQVFDGTMLNSTTTFNVAFPNKLGARVMFGVSKVTDLDYPEHRFGEGPYCSCDLELDPAGALDVLGGDLLYDVADWAKLTLGYRDHLLLLGAEGTKYEDSIPVELTRELPSETAPFLKQYGIRAQGVRMGAQVDVPVNDKWQIKADLGFYPYLNSKEAALWHCEDRGDTEQYGEFENPITDQKAFDGSIKAIYQLNEDWEIFIGYKYLYLMVDQFGDLNEEEIDEIIWDDYEAEEYRRWYDSHEATISGIQLGATYKF